MADNLSKKFALLCSCLMTMQALRLVISTAGFCVVRFHIDCALFNIFISRLVNAVMMSQLFGNWLGDLFVFGLNGLAKLIAAAAANWIQFGCFCSALICICHSECGHLTGFYWSMVLAYFWWKVSEAPTVGIAPGEVDYYYAGFTLSGVWAACLKGLVMRCVTGDTKTIHFNSDALGEVNVKIVGARSVKTTVDYRAAKWLYILTIVLTFLMCVVWTAIPFAVEQKDVETGQQKNTSGGNPKSGQEHEFKVTQWDSGNVVWDQADGTVTGWFTRHKGFGNVGVVGAEVWVLKATVGIAFGGVLAVPGAMFGVGVGWVFGKIAESCIFAKAEVGGGDVTDAHLANANSAMKWCQLIFGIVGAIGGFAAGAAPMAADGASAGKTMGWVWSDKWKWPWEKNVGVNTSPSNANLTKQAAGATETDDWVRQWAPMGGLGAGLVLGALTGLCIGSSKGKTKSGFCAGAFFGSFFGLLCGEIVNAVMAQTVNEWGKGAIAVIGFLIVVLGLGTVFSIYPGMAPCSITQFQYFNIIDILILALSAIAPMVIMGADLGGAPWRLGATIFGPDTVKKALWVGFGLVFVIATLVCEGIVLNIMQHPFSKMAQNVTTSPGLAVFLTVTMVTSQLTSSSIGFGCMAAGGGFNDGINNANSTLTLWTIECCSVLGEGYLTELKKYEPGKWPTQGMGKWDTYSWWNRKTFGNAWQIWCCIGTTDLRRDIMLCRQ